MSARISWIDEDTQSPAIEERARNLDSFVNAFADGRISESELATQEERLAELMKKIEPKLDDELHEQVTELLCELCVYDIMQMFHQMQQARPATRFRG